MSYVHAAVRRRCWVGAWQTIAGLTALFAAAALAPARAQTLPRPYQAALATDPAITGAAAPLRAAEQRVVQARAGFGPSAAATANRTATHYGEWPDFDLRPFHATQLTLQITQPVLRLTLLPTLDGAPAQVEQEQEQAQADLATARRENLLVDAAALDMRTPQRPNAAGPK